MQKGMMVYAPTNNKIVIIPFNETQNLTKLKTTIVAHVDGSNIFSMHLALVGVTNRGKELVSHFSKEILPGIIILLR